jgi:hypothetical protein
MSSPPSPLEKSIGKQYPKKASNPAEALLLCLASPIGLASRRASFYFFANKQA